MLALGSVSTVWANPNNHGGWNHGDNYQTATANSTQGGDKSPQANEFSTATDNSNNSDNSYAGVSGTGAAANTVKQEHDFSCGSAALATLLTYHYDDPVTEETVFKAMFARGNKEKIEREGFSLLDMKRYLEANGYYSDGYVTNLGKVAKVGKPVIVLINNGGYLHFVVIKGIDGEKVLIGDPATGARTLSRAVEQISICYP